MAQPNSRKYLFTAASANSKVASKEKSRHAVTPSFLIGEEFVHENSTGLCQLEKIHYMLDFRYVSFFMKAEQKIRLFTYKLPTLLAHKSTKEVFPCGSFFQFFFSSYFSLFCKSRFCLHLLQALLEMYSHAMCNVFKHTALKRAAIMCKDGQIEKQNNMVSYNLEAQNTQIGLLK